MLENKLSLERAEEILDIPSRTMEVNVIMSNLKNALEENKELMGISSPQLGEDVRVIALRFEDGIHYFFNPLGNKFKDIKVIVEEWYGKKYLHTRFETIEFFYQQESGYPNQIELTGYPAYVFQQQLELLDGITPDMIGIEVDDDFFNLTDEEKAIIIKEYVTSLQNRMDELKQEIQETPELRDRQRAIDFFNSVAKGETVLASSLEKKKQPNRATRRANAKRNRKIVKEMEKAAKLEEASNDRKKDN